MPSSVIIGGLVLAWIVVLVPMVARKRQEVGRTADSALAARVVQRTAEARRGGAAARARLEDAMPDDEDRATDATPDPTATPEPEVDTSIDVDNIDDIDEQDDIDDTVDPIDHRRAVDVDDVDELDEPRESDDQLTAELPLPEDVQYVTRPYRPGRGGYNAEAAELAAAAKYALRRRVVVTLLTTTVLTVLLGLLAYQPLCWAALLLAVVLAGYLTYLRRQVRIETEIRRRRAARIRAARSAATRDVSPYLEVDTPAPEAPQPAADDYPDEPALPPLPPRTTRMTVQPGTAIVDGDDGDPAFDDLDEPDVLPYRRAAGQ